MGRAMPSRIPSSSNCLTRTWSTSRCPWTRGASAAGAGATESCYNGPESFHPDNQFIIGEAPETPSFVAAGFNSWASPLPEVRAKRWPEWIVAGEPSTSIGQGSAASPIQGNPTYCASESSEVLGTVRLNCEFELVGHSDLASPRPSCREQERSRQPTKRQRLRTAGTSRELTHRGPAGLGRLVPQSRFRLRRLDQTSFRYLVIWVSARAAALGHVVCQLPIVDVPTGRTRRTAMLNAQRATSTRLDRHASPAPGPRSSLVLSRRRRRPCAISRRLVAAASPAASAGAYGRRRHRCVCQRSASWGLRSARVARVAPAGPSVFDARCICSAPAGSSRRAGISRAHPRRRTGWELLSPPGAGGQPLRRPPPPRQPGRPRAGYYAIEAMRPKVRQQCASGCGSRTTSPESRPVSPPAKLGTDADFLGRAAESANKAAGANEAVSFTVGIAAYLWVGCWCCKWR